MSTIALPKTSSYDRTMQLFGGMWFMLLALGVAIKIGSSAHDPWPSLLSSVCLAVFYVLLALLVITRPPAKAQANGRLPRIAAFVGTYMPWTIAFFGETDKALPNLASTVCVLIGMIMMLVTIRHLGRSFSLVPQARNVVQTGPYRWIKHPLYLAEEIAVLGVVLRSPTPLTAVLLVLHIGVQVCRIYYEEDLLRRNCPEYSGYEASRWRVIPYVW
ncbi:protein-S-isoprenylcysteine O-methyltransferase Ste14 [Bradyrhizobium sp. CIR48]|uniref:methyltransferase family protein n=1 Tax=unclassified Bradyrhizobium TaxID=2631580 RepID=UPI00036C4394|nr:MULTISPECIES: methyltransferase [unclassified Bradyrhizobium]MBB4377210.1 protein-S-isoprenylcysteine O-methyltransferase Ste14 [Bradyrhizobium sp. SBR1B]MBB4423386.1 protein-S-isoprenylcysteine O-methyltransferase Ste14 [Bradyrhizobium sp. CIR48]SFM62876.1 Protein-S-isoprenylcysteine O-methyltransferase Ste14 [Bradyrhizobium sp. Rc3b]